MHTPGPWSIWNEHLELDPHTATGFPLIVAPGPDGSQDICEVNADVDEYVGNTHAIAAVPVMLAALKHVRDNWQRNLTESMRRVNEAIDLAEGRKG